MAAPVEQLMAVANSAPPSEWAVLAVIVGAFFKGMDIAKTMYLHRQRVAVTKEDPLHVKRTEEIYEHLRDMPPQGCHWKGRDEIRDFFDALRAQVAASSAQTTAINQLTEEIRRNRIMNGGTGK